MLYDVIWNVHPPWDVFFHGGPQGIIPSCWYSYHQGKQWTPMFERCPWNGVQLRWRPRSLAPPPACTSAMPAASPAAAMRLCTLGAPRWMFDLGFRIISRWFQDDFKVIQLYSEKKRKLQVCMNFGLKTLLARIMKSMQRSWSCWNDVPSEVSDRKCCQEGVHFLKSSSNKYSEMPSPLDPEMFMV